MWKMLACAFLAPSPRLYISKPQATEQYGQVLRVSVALASLNSRTSASAGVGEKPIRASEEPARVTPVTLRNWRRVMSAIRVLPLLQDCRKHSPRLCTEQGKVQHCCRERLARRYYYFRR